MRRNHNETKEIEIKVGDYWGKKRIKEIKKLSNGWILLKTENSKSEKDFKVKVVFSINPKSSLTPKHAHFLIDFYGKLCANKEKAKKLLLAIVEVWKGECVEEVLKKYKKDTEDLPGYPLEYILYSLNWILEQEDINFRNRPQKKQEEINKILEKQGIKILEERKGSQLAISLFCDVMGGTHPVEALLKANLDVRPKGKPFF